jgi:L-asparaginase
MSPYTLVVQRASLPVLVIHGGAGAYLRTTTESERQARGRTLADIVTRAHRLFANGTRAAVLGAMGDLEQDEQFNAGYGARLQRDGRARLSASLMDGGALRMSSVINVEDCLHPAALADRLQSRADRNLDGGGARLLMDELGVPPVDVRSPRSVERWRELVAKGDAVDREAAIGSAGAVELERARSADLPIPGDLARPRRSEPSGGRHGTVGAVGCDAARAIWAATSTGGRGHESPGRVSDSPTVAGNYACSAVALSATGFGEQIIDLNLCGRIATRMIDGASLEIALRRTFDEVAAMGGLCGVIAVAADGTVGYAHTTEACGVAWCDPSGVVHLDVNSR